MKPHRDYSENYLDKYGMINVLKFRTLFSFCSQTYAGYQGWNSQTASQKSEQGRP